MSKGEELGGIEYHGIPGASKDCQDAVMRLLQFGDIITHVRIISCASTHCLLLTKELGDVVAIKSGFSSGYGGEGPTALSYVLQLLTAHGTEIDECEVSDDVIERLDHSALTEIDLKNIEDAKPIRPSRWPDYIREHHIDSQREGTYWQDFPPIVPFAIIDARIADLALNFWQNPPHNLLTGYKRLEDIVRERTGLGEHGSKLFSMAFGNNARLYWENVDEGEKTGRVQLFTGTYMAHRNPLAHRELKNKSIEQLTEFLLLNHLYLLEKESCLVGELQQENASKMAATKQ